MSQSNDRTCDLPAFSFDCYLEADSLRVDVTDLYQQTMQTFETDGKDWWHIEPGGERVKAERPERINAALGWS